EHDQVIRASNCLCRLVSALFLGGHDGCRRAARTIIIGHSREEPHMKKLCIILAAVGVALFSPVLRAADYPSKPITIVAVFGPGSASDTICRIIADKLGPALGNPVIVEDRPGADGALAAAYVHHQPADGYTLLMGTNSPLSADPFIHKGLNYDPIKDFVPITRVGSFTLILVVNPALPIHSVKELADYPK